MNYRYKMIDFVLNKELGKYAKDFGFSKIYRVDIIKGKNLSELRKKINFAKDLVIVQGNYKLNEDCTDIRLVDNESNNVSYWIESG